MICSYQGKISSPFSAQGVFSDALRKVKLGVVNRQDCRSRLQQHSRFQGSGFKVSPQESFMGNVDSIIANWACNSVVDSSGKELHTCIAKDACIHSSTASLTPCSSWTILLYASGG